MKKKESFDIPIIMTMSIEADSEEQAQEKAGDEIKDAMNTLYDRGHLGVADAMSDATIED